MAVPKKKKSRSKRNMHRSHLAIEPKNIAVCTATGEFMLSHNIAIDGSYKGKRIFIKQQKE
ncbi:50S ribosomal protein L32 [Wolbachia endosymbiont of Cruorifilaria tuberocauda]|uniref:50S ribosomal protein L32 n=1 Tax=Wolbachia endosymbiont of Cruorifilaria tuberocauda TaxID=1812111 RepID=UPI00158B043B|nr:50S ribosomal protein L32 [Wolbachia endosymbiont of Cruorifilaria tuberocauda]QKX01837.1 50S ribosomal protein L32 [Wolbachia endosymbiont of Cruorifilaria tuberocauda]